MTDKKRIAELDAAIKERSAALSEAKQAVKSAAGDPERLVLAEKVARRISAELQALAQAKAAARYKPPEPTDRDELLQGLQKYYAAHDDRLSKARQAIASADREKAELEAGLQQAAKDCDTEATINLSVRKSDNEAKRKALEDMLKRAESLPIFPEGALMEEWASICEQLMPDWRAAVLRVETLAQEYEAACHSLLQMCDTIVAVREGLSSAATSANATPPTFAPVFTIGLDCEKLIVQKGQLNALAQLSRPVIGFAV